MSVENPDRAAAGFAPHRRKSPLTAPWEPLYARETERAVVLGLTPARPTPTAAASSTAG